ncbi:MAG: thioredoxin-dependent thiol peroxidase [Robiginitomaculum sp.]|nr:MAG: thioredoxin-dependent thiol peroxidase [Robiginitomaculum sp.]
MDIGQIAPDFNLSTDSSGIVTLSNLRENMVVLYFYPKDNTPGCTSEAIAFSELKAEFDALGVKIIGVSKDSPRKHDNFKAKYQLNITLASDEEGETIRDYGVWVEKKLYGRVYMGIERATFLIAADGSIAHVWRKVRVKGHAQDVLDTARSLHAS